MHRKHSFICSRAIYLSYTCSIIPLARISLSVYRGVFPIHSHDIASKLGNPFYLPKGKEISFLARVSGSEAFFHYDKRTGENKSSVKGI